MVDEPLDDFLGPVSLVRGPTKTYSAPAATKRSTRSWAEGAIDLGDPRGGELLEVEPRVEDVDVEAVLVGGVAEPAEAPAEGAAVRPADVGDPDPRRNRVGGPVLGDHRESRSRVSAPRPSGARAGWALCSAESPR